FARALARISGIEIQRHRHWDSPSKNSSNLTVGHSPSSSDLPARHSSLIERAFFDDALIGLAFTLDTVLEFAVPLWKIRENLVGSRNCIAYGIAPVEADHGPDRKAMAHGCMLVNPADH